jgi:hypothetical protein
MNIVRDDFDERQARVDRMVDEFRKAQSLRLTKTTTAKGDAQDVELQRDAHAHGNRRRVNCYTTHLILV